MSNAAFLSFEYPLTREPISLHSICGKLASSKQCMERETTTWDACFEKLRRSVIALEITQFKSPSKKALRWMTVTKRSQLFQTFWNSFRFTKITLFGSLKIVIKDRRIRVDAIEFWISYPFADFTSSWLLSMWFLRIAIKTRHTSIPIVLSLKRWWLHSWSARHSSWLRDTWIFFGSRIWRKIDHARSVVEDRCPPWRLCLSSTFDYTFRFIQNPSVETPIIFNNRFIWVRTIIAF